MNYRVAIRAKGERTRSFNGLVFATRFEADSYGRDLWSRWMAVEAYEIEETDLPVTATFSLGGAVLLSKEKR